MTAMNSWRGAAGAVSLALMMSGAAQAQVPADLKPKIAAIGRVVNPPGTAALYAPLQPSAPYAGVTVTRDVAYGPSPRNLLDVFQPAKPGAKQPVLIYVAGGPGNKIEPGPGGEHFYDNIMLWAVKNGMVGVNVMRQPGFGGPWDTNAKDMQAAVQWVHDNAARLGGDPDRVFIWAHSAANDGVATYLAFPQFHTKAGVGVKGAILMSGVPNILPLKPEAQGIPFAPGMGGPPPGGPPPGGAAGAPPPGPPPGPRPDPAHSVLPGLSASKTPLFIVAAELDPPIMTQTATLLDGALTKAGQKHRLLIVKDHGHMSEVFAPNTADVSVTGPILQWMRGVR